MQRTNSPRPEAAERAEGSLLAEALRSITRTVSRHPRTTLSIVGLITCVAVVYTLCGLRFKTERADLIDPEADFQRRWLQFAESFGEESDLVVVVQGENADAVKQTIEDLGGRIVREPSLFSRVLYKVEPGRLRSKGLQYLAPFQLEAGLRQLGQYRPLLQARNTAEAWNPIRLDSLFWRLKLQVEHSRGPEHLQAQMQHADLLVGSMGAFLADPEKFRSPWPQILPVDPRFLEQSNKVVYFLNDRGTMGFLKASPLKAEGFDGYTKSIDRLRELADEVMEVRPGSKISVTGIPVLENDEMRRSQSDMMIASTLSFVGVGLLLLIGFRGWRHPSLALVTLAIGMAWSFAYTTLVVGHLNILSVSFAVVLIGLGIDFAIHYLARYLQLRREGHLLRPALREAATGVGPGIIAAAVTTALAFFCATLTQFIGVAELGIIAGGGILLCVIATFVVLPPLVSLADHQTAPGKLPTPFQANWFRGFVARFPLPVTALSLLGVAAIGAQMLEYGDDGQLRMRVRYDHNLLNLQADGLESVEVQKLVFENTNDSLLFAVSVADSPEEALELRRKFEALPTVHHVEDLASRLPQLPAEQTRLLIQAYRAELADLPQQPPVVGPLNPRDVGMRMEQFYLAIRNRRDPVCTRVAQALDRLLNEFDRMPVREQVAFLNAFQMRTTAALLGQFQALAAATNPEPVQLSDLPPELISRFVSQDGKWLLQVYPKEQIWDIGPLTRFVKDVRSVDQEITGTPLQNYEASRQIKQSYEMSSLYALAAICLVLLFDLLGREQKWLVLLPPLVIVGFAALILQARRSELTLLFLVSSYLAMAAAIAAVLDVRNLRDALLALVPPLGGGLVMFGFFGMMGIDLNPANLIVLPLVLGIGVDNGVHIIHDFRSQSGRYQISASTMNAIVLTSLTTIVGFGSMTVAAHRGLNSVGLVLVIGVSSCLFLSVVALPAGLALVSRGRGEGAQAVSIPLPAGEPKAAVSVRKKAA